MKRNHPLSPLLLLLILALGACSPAPNPSAMPAAAPSAVSSEPPAAEGACPTPGAGQALLRNDEKGYCLLYPAAYSADISNYIVINPSGAPGDMLGEAWAAIYVEPAGGLTAAQAADAKIAEAGAGFNITRTELTVDGTPAVMVDGLPGPDPLRRVFIVRNDRLYSLIFMPWGSGNPAFPLLEALYTTIMQTLHFTAPTAALPTPTQPWGPGNLPPPLIFVLPADGAVLAYEGDYWFQVNDIGADGYLWRFSQNGVVVWENLRDEMGLTAGGTYLIAAGSEAHSRFVPGPVEVSVQAQKGDYLAEPALITVSLELR